MPVALNGAFTVTARKYDSDGPRARHDAYLELVGVTPRAFDVLVAVMSHETVYGTPAKSADVLELLGGSNDLYLSELVRGRWLDAEGRSNGLSVRINPEGRRTSMERAIEIGTAVERANKAVEALGMGSSVCVVYFDGTARLVDSRGRTLFEHRDEEPAVACSCAVAHLEVAIFNLLTAKP
jgi:hypothetical protein